MALCKCGCGSKIVQRYSWYTAKYILGHNKGNWKCGKYLHGGYVYVRMPKHHFANCQGYILEHRLVFESHNKCSLLPWAIVHHINSIKTDNNPNNLKLTGRAAHMNIHRPLPIRVISEEQRMRLSTIMKSRRQPRCAITGRFITSKTTSV